MTASTFSHYARHDARKRRAELKSKIAKMELTAQATARAGDRNPARRERN